MMPLPYDLIPEGDLPKPIGLIVLQADETLEPEFHRSFAQTKAALYVSRIASAPEVTPDTLRAMKGDIAASADLLPKSLRYAVVGYGCTSASAIIGSEAVADLVRQSCATDAVTDPLQAAIAFARHHDLSRLAVLSPYIAEVNAPLRAGFAAAGIATDTFGSFEEAEEARVARISEHSIVEAATRLGQSENVDGVFLSCTNLKTCAAIPQIVANIGKPVFSSNSALSWHIKKCANL